MKTSRGEASLKIRWVFDIVFRVIFVMGNSAGFFPVDAAPIMDYRVERCMKQFMCKMPYSYSIDPCIQFLSLVPKKQVDTLWLLFKKYDREGNNYLVCSATRLHHPNVFQTADDFFERIIKFPRSGLTDSMFRLIGKLLTIFPVLYSHICLKTQEVTPISPLGSS